MTEEKQTAADLSAWLEAVEPIAEEAGRAILAVYETDFEVEHKDDRTPVTQADMAAHRVIVQRLRELEPDIPVLSEESSHIPFEQRRQWGRYWLVDPLDGTREFIKRNGEFTVNIALIAGHEPVLGVVHSPVLDRTYFAASGQGAWRRDGKRDAEPIRVRAPSSPLVVAGSRSHGGDALQGFLDRIGDYELIPMGSSLKFGLVAEGTADLYVRLGKTSEWDTAAAHAVVNEAGGQVTDTAMQPLRYNTKESLLNPEFFVFGETDVNWSQYLREE